MTDIAAANPHAAMIRVEPKNATRYAGQRRHDLRIGHQPDYVDADRAHLNRVLIAPPTAAELRSVCEDRRAQRDMRRAMKANASVGMVGLVGFGTEAQALFSAMPVTDQDRALRLAARLAARRMGTTVAGLVFHGDETAPHAHVVFPAYDRTGQPLTETVGRAVLKGLQDDMAAAFSRYAPGIERGRSRTERLAAGADYADTVNRSVRELHHDLPAEIAAKRAEAEAAGAALLAAQGRAKEMQGRVDKLTSLARDLTAAETKRLANYEKRLADRQAEVAAVESAIETARAEADRLIAAADRDATAIRENAAASADAAAAAFSALAVQIRDGTIAQSESGKILSPDASALRPGGAALADVARTMIALTDDMKAARDEAEKTRRAADEDLAQVRSMKAALAGLIGRVKAFLGRPDVSRYTKIAAEGRDMTADVMAQMREIDAKGASPAKKPIPEADPDRIDDGTDFGEP